MPGEKFYEEQEADEILRLAAGDPLITTAMTRERLVQTAAELGIPAEAIDRAEQQLARQKTESERKKAEELELAEFNADRRRKSFSSLGSWASTSIILVGIDLITTHSITWSVWPVGIWGLFEIGQAIETLLSPKSHGEQFERWKRKRARRAEKNSG